MVCSWAWLHSQLFLSDPANHGGLDESLLDMITLPRASTAAVRYHCCNTSTVAWLEYRKRTTSRWAYDASEGAPVTAGWMGGSFDLGGLTLSRGLTYILWEC
jgi:hypothetical protein